MPKNKTKETINPNQELTSVFLGRDALFPIHNGHNQIPRELLEHVGVIFSQLSKTLMEAMKYWGVHIGHIEIPWYPEVNVSDTMQKVMKVNSIRVAIELDESVGGKVSKSKVRRSHT